MINKAEESRRKETDVVKTDTLSWSERRARLLRQACEYITRQLSEGIPSGRAIERSAARFRSRSLGGGRRLRLSAKTMQRIWYEWRRHGDNSVFSLKYKPGKPRFIVDRDCVRAVVTECLRTGRSVADVIRSNPLRTTQGEAVSIHSAYRILRSQRPAATTIAEVSAARRAILKELGRVNRKAEAISQ